MIPHGKQTTMNRVVTHMMTGAEAVSFIALTNQLAAVVENHVQGYARLLGERGHSAGDITNLADAQFDVIDAAKTRGLNLGLWEGDMK